MNEEKEIKILLSEEEYNKIFNLFVWSNEFTQVNHYYGSKEDIFSKKNTYRVREKNGKITLQIKVPKAFDGSLHIKNEYEKPLDSIPANLDQKELSEITGLEISENKSYLGSLTTVRKICSEYDHTEICLDKNIYLDSVDYEIEIEFTSDYPHNIVQILEQNGIHCQKIVLGKYTRYVHRLIANK